MDTWNDQSEVAQLMRRITEEYEAAQRGLTGFAYGAAQHEFITARMENVGQMHEELVDLVGPEQAIQMIAKVQEAVL